jgi:hypothetical protein
MGRNRLNPWPPVADLFSALTVVSLAGFIMITLGAVVLTKDERIERDAAVNIATAFSASYKPVNDEHIRVMPCTDRPTEQCIDIDFRFERNRVELSLEGVRQVERACSIYSAATKQIIDQFHSHGKHLELADLSLQIEGHTDITIPSQMEDRDQFLFNWTLSSGRAATVLYEFRQKCNISPETGYKIRSVGLAATRPICTDPAPDEACNTKNRRTTMRLRVELDRPTQEAKSLTE